MPGFSGLVDPSVRPYLGPARTNLARTAGLTLLASAVAVGVALSLAEATTRILTSSSAPWPPLILAAVLLLVHAGLLWLRDLSAHHTGAAVVAQLHRRLLDRVAELGPGHQWPGGAAKAHLIVVDGCEHLRGYLGTYLPQVLTALLVPAVLITVLAVYDPLVALVVLVLYLATECFRRLGDLQTHWHESFYGLNAARAIKALLEEEAPVKEARRPSPMAATGPPELRCEGVTFRYRGASRDALTSVTATFPRGTSPRSWDPPALEKPP